MRLALSIRQPWAWLIVAGFKDIENRKWSTAVRGTILVHAGKGILEGEWEDAVTFVRSIRPTITIPVREDLELGGIVGQVDITDCVSDSDSPWFCGPFGFVLANARRLPFRPCRGRLGFFRVPDNLR